MVKIPDRHLRSTHFSTARGAAWVMCIIIGKLNLLKGYEYDPEVADAGFVHAINGFSPLSVLLDNLSDKLQKEFYSDDS
jgi:hypothetical protein